MESSMEGNIEINPALQTGKLQPDRAWDNQIAGWDSYSEYTDGEMAMQQDVVGNELIE